MVGTDQVLCGVGVGAGGDVYAVAVVLLVGAEGVGDIEVVDGVDGEVYQGLADAVGPEHLADDVFAWEGERRVAQLEGVAVADDGVEGVVLDAGRGDGNAHDGVLCAGAAGE